MQFTYIQAPRDLQETDIKALYESLLKKLEELGASESAWLSALDHWNELKAYLEGEYARRSYAEACNALDKDTETRMRWYRETVVPIATIEDAKIRTLVLKSPVRGALEKHVGKHLFNIWEAQEISAHPINIPQVTQLGALESEYARIKASAEIDFMGEKLTLTQLGTKLIEKDETIRKSAFETSVAWWAKNQADMDRIYGEMIKLRQQMALNLNLPNYTPLGYKAMNRSEYSPTEVALFREEVKKYAVPVYKRLREKQAKELGAATIKPWNRSFFPSFTLAPKIVPIETQLQKAEVLFSGMHPKLGAHFKRMADFKLIDLENRKGKRSGAFCTSMPDEDKVMLFCNSTGDADDISAIVHESGHSFQGWESLWIKQIELRWPTLEACEIHSMGMEFLALDHMSIFFKPEDAKKFRMERLEQTVSLFPYICVVDEFQHHVYAHPQWTGDERAACWSRTWDTYMIGDDFGGYENFKAHMWQRQGHIYSSPFYYIDYALAETCALQLWLENRRDPKQTMEKYLQLCHIGGSKAFVSIVESAGLQNPFKPGVLKPLMDEVAKELGLGIY